MHYKIIANANGVKRTAEVKGIKALNSNLARMRGKGWEIADITRVRSIVVR